MGRLVAFLFLALALAAPSAMAREACDGFQVGTFVDGVPYFTQRMSRTDAGGVSAFVHPDDARISVSYRLQAVGEQPRTSRADFVKALQKRLAGEYPDRADVTYRTSVNPYDPLSWTVQARRQVGEDVDSNGTLTVRVAPTCHLVAAWHVFETPVLGSRIKEFNLALEAVRTLAAQKMAPSGFMPDSTVPLGPSSLVFGILLPLIAAAVLFVSMRSMIFHGDAGAPARAVSAAAAASVLVTFAVQVPYYQEGLPEMRYMDNAGLLAIVALSCLAAAALGRARVVLWSYALSLCAGAALAVGAMLGWSPDRAVCGPLSGALLLSGVAGLWLWQMQASATGRGRRSPRVA